MPRLVSSPEEIDPDWLTDVLRAAGSLGDGRVISAAPTNIGTGKMADNVRYSLVLDGAPKGAPSSVVAKLPAADATSRASGAGAYRRETLFYRELAPQLTMRTPRCYYAAVDDDGDAFVILMEDMSPAEPGDQTEECSLDTARLAVAEVVGLHVLFWGSGRLARFEWIMPSSPESAAVGGAFMQAMWPGFLERFGAELGAEALAAGQRFCDGFEAWANRYGGPQCLVHADYRTENMLFGAPGSTAPPIAVVDWQTVTSAGPLTDVAYVLGGSTGIETRRRHEREVVADYCARLRTAGVGYSDDQGWADYCHFSWHGVMITVLGAMATGADPRGDRMFIAMARRHLQHALDLGQDALG